MKNVLTYGGYPLSCLAFSLLVSLSDTKQPTTLLYVLTLAFLLPVPILFLCSLTSARDTARTQLEKAEVDCQNQNHNMFRERIHIVHDDYNKYVLRHMLALTTTLVIDFVVLFIVST